MAAFKPYVADEQKMPEFTFSAVALGALLGLLFAASSLYLVLKVGMTVSASIPVAVLAITLFRVVSKYTGMRQATILENNIVQTAGSAGESIAFGVGVTMPTLLLLGFDMDFTRIMVVAILGGLLGILAMIPLRRAFIVKMHGRPGQPGTLLYPEGTACAQVLISGEKGGTTGKTVFVGFGIAFLHKFVTEGMGLLMEVVKLPFTFINKMAVFATAMQSELLGVGYIIGYRTSAIMMAGAVLGYLVIIPSIYFIGESAPTIIKPGDKPIGDMSLNEIRNNYLLFIGAGCVAAAGILSMIKTLPMIISGVAGSLRTVGAVQGDNNQKRRTENDMSMRVVLGGSIGLIALLAIFLTTEVGVIAGVAGAMLVVLFGFLFVTVSARLTGEIGSSSNPISGMTTATLMLTCLIFLALGWQSSTDRLLALSIAAVVCIASSNGGTTAQALKTGFLVGGTPKAMQWAILVGALVSALVIGGTLIVFNASRTVVSMKESNVPNLTLTEAEMERLTETATYQGQMFKVWHTRSGILTEPDKARNFEPRSELMPFKEMRRVFYVNPQTRTLAAMRDDGIMGVLTEQDDGSYIKREFEAPKTQVMGIVINGVLKGDLNWSMIGIGAMITLMLELSGVSALAFAVGVYVPIQYSAPIFIGGIMRWLVDGYLAKQAAADAERKLQAALDAAGDDPAARIQAEQEAKAQAEIDAIRRSETSGGVLLASGYIAGGSIAGVLLGFLAFHDDLPDDLKVYEYNKTAIVKEARFGELAEHYAREELGLTGVTLDPIHDKTTLDRLNSRIKELKSINNTLPFEYIRVPKGSLLKIPGMPEYKAERDMLLREVAAETLGRERKAARIVEYHERKRAELPPEEAGKYLPLKEVELIPAGVEFNLPSRPWTALIGFAVLCLFLLLVGFGKLFPSRE